MRSDKFRRTIGRLNPAILLLALAAASCAKPQNPARMSALERAGARALSADEVRGLSRVAGAKVYVPIYSHIFHREGAVFDLTCTLSIRNTDAGNPIIITTAKYFDTRGEAVREYVESPALLPPLATLDYVVGETDRTGGSGANFIVEWMAEKAVSEPIIESVMIGTTGQQGISFLSVGQAIR